MTVLNASEVELETARKIFWLLAHDHIFLCTYNEDKDNWDDGTYPAINCNDLFVPGADAEGLSAEDLDLYIEACKKFPRYGSYAWCAVKRSAKPWRWTERYEENDDYNAAVRGVTELMNRS